MSKEPSKLRAEEDGIFDDTGVIAVCFTSTKAREIGRKEACANAKLFAASRDMLEALKFCVSVFKAQGMFDLSEQIAVDKAETAIKLATT